MLFRSTHDGLHDRVSHFEGATEAGCRRVVRPDTKYRKTIVSESNLEVSDLIARQNCDTLRLHQKVSPTQPSRHAGETFSARCGNPHSPTPTCSSRPQPLDRSCRCDVTRRHVKGDRVTALVLSPIRLCPLGCPKGSDAGLAFEDILPSGWARCPQRTVQN